MPSRGPAFLSRVHGAAARTVSFSFHLGCHRSAVSLSALNVSSLTQTIAPVWESGPCFSSPARWGRSSPSNTPVLPPSYFILLSSAWFYRFFSSGQVLLSALSWCSACTAVWRCITDVSVEKDVPQVHLLRRHLVLFLLLCPVLLESELRNHCQIRHHKAFSCTFSSGNLRGWCHTVMFLIHFELLFVRMQAKGSTLYFCTQSVSQCCLLKDLSFPHEMSWHSCFQSFDYIHEVSFLGSLFTSVVLQVCLCASTTSFDYCRFVIYFKFRILRPPTLFSRFFFF